MRSLDLLELPCSRFGQLELEVNLRHALEEKEGSQQKHQKKHQSHQRLKLEKGRLRVEAASSASSRSSSFSGGGDGSTILHLQDVGDMSDQEEEEDDLEDGLSKWRPVVEVGWCWLRVLCDAKDEPERVQLAGANAAKTPAEQEQAMRGHAVMPCSHDQKQTTA